MKKGIGLILTVILSLFFVVAANAQVPSPTTSSYQTAFNIQNLSGSTATCVVQFYDSAGANSFSLNGISINAGAVADFYTGNDGVFGGMAAGQYSAVVSCDQPVAAVVNYSDGNSAASSAGLSSSAIGQTFYAPGIYDNFYGFYSNIVIQNTTGSPINITADILAPGGATAKTFTANNVPAYASVVFDQTNDGSLDQNVAYSAVINGTGNIAAVVNIYNNSDQLYAYNPFTAGANEMSAPIIMNNYYGYNTALTVQNIHSSTDANVEVQYSNGMTETQTIAAGSSHAFITANSPLPAGNTLYSAKVVSTNSIPVVALVNQSNGYNRAASYVAFAGGATSVNVPITLRSYYGYDSSITCQNVGNADATITIDYAGVAGNTVSGAIAPNAVFSQVQAQDANLNGVGNNWISSAVVTSTQDIVCVVNQDIISGSGATTSQDVLQSYEGIGN